MCICMCVSRSFFLKLFRRMLFVGISVSFVFVFDSIDKSLLKLDHCRRRMHGNQKKAIKNSHSKLSLSLSPNFIRSEQVFRSLAGLIRHQIAYCGTTQKTNARNDGKGKEKKQQQLNWHDEHIVIWPDARRPCGRGNGRGRRRKTVGRLFSFAQQCDILSFHLVSARRCDSNSLFVHTDTHWDASSEMLNVRKRKALETADIKIIIEAFSGFSPPGHC